MRRRSTTGLVLPMLILTTFAPIAQISGAELMPADYCVEVDGIADWSTSRAYIDAGMLFRRWGQAGAGWEENPALKLTAENLPLMDADAVSHMRGYPNGIYKLRYEGSALVTFYGIGQIVEGTVKRGGGVTTADVQLTHRGFADVLTLQVRNVRAKDPLRSLQLVAPGYTAEDAKKKVFTDEFVRRVRPFHTIRFMGWQQTNASPQKEWADRPKPEQFGRTTARGIPLEEIVLLANVTRRNVWVNVPHLASEDYVRQFATFLRDHLHKDAVIHVEYSNELWNFIFLQAKDNLFAARANAKLTKPDDFGRCAQQAGEKLGQCARIFKQVFGDGEFEKRVRMVVGGFIALDYWAQQQLLWIGQHHPGLMKELAIAPYFGVEKDIAPVDKPGATADQLFDAADNWIDEKVATWVQKHARLASEHKLTLVAYEAGNHFTFHNEINGPLKLSMQNHPRMAQTYQHLIDVWGENGGTLFNQFGHISAYGKFGSWGLLQSMDDPGSVKWDFFMGKVLAKGDADLDGAVTFADFQILKNHMGQAEKWWEQGDFNADNKVDREDLKLMRGNLKGLTAEQERAVEQLAR